MLFRCHGLCAPTPIVCPGAIHTQSSDEEEVESHLPNSCPRGTVQLWLLSDWWQCTLIDEGYVLHARERLRNRQHYAAQKACPAGVPHISSNAVICQYHQFPLTLVRKSKQPGEDPLENWAIAAPVMKRTTCSWVPTNHSSNKEIQGIINDGWNGNPLGGRIHGKGKHEHLVPALHRQHWDPDTVEDLSRWVPAPCSRQPKYLRSRCTL